jgi:hypothetical protein
MTKRRRRDYRKPTDFFDLIEAMVGAVVSLVRRLFRRR